ncbi:MAG: 6,7-dimethyl-8-ribityllumazine synthase [Gemmatimonadaceae bacterium]|nr:6,7-dimethyl-8-ribityllumazine synthase [Gemmatimonadaceae bacterium]
MPEFIGSPDGAGRRVAVIVSRFNETVTQALGEGAVATLVECGVTFDDIDVVVVPGAWELPTAARALLGTGRYDCMVVVGAIVRGGTPHFEFVAGETSRAIMHLGTEFEVPIGFGLLTTDTMAQAEARSGGEYGNKGRDAALAALEMADLLARLDSIDAGELDGQAEA